MVHKVNCTCTNLHKSCYYKESVEVSNLLRNGEDVNAKDCYGRTPLMCVFLLYRGVEKDIKGLQTKLLDITSVLIKHGAKINEIDENNDTAFHHIAKITPFIRKDKILLQPIRLLLGNGGDGYIKNEEGKTAYQIAFENRSLNVGVLLQITESQTQTLKYKYHKENEERKETPISLKKQTPPPLYKDLDPNKKEEESTENINKIGFKDSIENVDAFVEEKKIKERKTPVPKSPLVNEGMGKGFWE